MKIRSIVCTVVAGLTINILLVNVVYAYLDPGTGGALIQGILAALATIVVIGKLYWYRLLRFFGIRKSKVDKEQIETSDEQNNSK
jgi:hypothetical protein